MPGFRDTVKKSAIQSQEKGMIEMEKGRGEEWADSMSFYTASIAILVIFL